MLRISVSIVLDSHKSSVAESFSRGVLSSVPGGRISKLQEHLLNTVYSWILHVVEISVQFLGTGLFCIGLEISG